MSRNKALRIIISAIALVTGLYVHWYSTDNHYVDLKYISQVHPVEYNDQLLGVVRVNYGELPNDDFSPWFCISNDYYSSYYVRKRYEYLLPDIDEEEYGIIMSFGRKIETLTYKIGSMTMNDYFFFDIEKPHEPIGFAAMEKQFYPETVFIYIFNRNNVPKRSLLSSDEYRYQSIVAIEK